MRAKGIFHCAGLAALLVFGHSAQAQGADRIEQLEAEVLALKQRITRIEATMGTPAAPKPAASVDGWKSVASWRQLKTNMTPNQVRAILGEPARLDGGGVAHWYYPNGGRTTFISDELSQWVEPK